MLWRAVVRTDPKRGDDLKRVPALEEAARGAASALASDAWGKDSLSGEERNRLFLSLGGRQFADVSGLSGADHVGDGRSVVLLDYDRDGLTDIASVNTNAPKLVLYRNEVAAGELGGGNGHFLALRFAGGARAGAREGRWSNRDGYGARVEVRAGSQVFVEEHRCGEGYSAQNSPVLRIGLGPVEEIGSVKVTWPSGRVTEAGPVPVDQLVTVFENPEDSPGGENVVVERYLAPGGTTGPVAGTPGSDAPVFSPGGEPEAESSLRVHVLMATWCASCLGEIPYLHWLASQWDEGQVEIVGVPVDPADSEEKLDTYAREHRPPYRIAAPLADGDRAVLDRVFQRDIAGQSLPAALVTGRDGRVLWSGGRVPTVSDLRQALAAVDRVE